MKAAAGGLMTKDERTQRIRAFERMLRPLAEVVMPSAANLPRVRFSGVVYVFVGAPDQSEGAIATVDEYERGQCSFAYLKPDGRVLRFGLVIGTRDDIEWLEDEGRRDA